MPSCQPLICTAQAFMKSSVHCWRVSSGLVTVWPTVFSLLKISWSLPPCSATQHSIPLSASSSAAAAGQQKVNAQGVQYCRRRGQYASQTGLRYNAARLAAPT